MDLTPTDDQLALRDTVRRLLDRESGSAAVRTAMASALGYDADLWSRMCTEIGVAALAVPERFGGVGASLAETAVVLAELGRGLTPSPLLGTVVAAEALLATADARACATWLPGIADGSVLPALVWADTAGHWAPDGIACTATQSASGTWALSGDAHYVPHGDQADLLLVLATTPSGSRLYTVDPAQDAVRRTHTPAMDPTRRLARVTLTAATGQLLGADDFSAPLQRIRDVACTLLSAEQVGAAERALAITVEYTKTRRQFGRPIGGFQALKHRMADLYVLTETARSTAMAATWSLLHDDADERSRAAAVAKSYCSTAFTRVAAEMIQLHGGIGITWEHDAHLYLKRAHGSAHLFGSPADHDRRLQTAYSVTP